MSRNDQPSAAGTGSYDCDVSPYPRSWPAGWLASANYVVTDRPPIFQSAGSRHWSRVREQCPQQPHPRAAIEARRAGLEIVQWFHDPAVSGADPEASGVRTVLSLWRTQAAFARDLVAEELGVLLLIAVTISRTLATLRGS
jgi:hypothetical protein